MQKIENILSQLLSEHNCVVIPGFGAFLAEREGAWIHPVTQRFYPPKKRVAFNAQLTVNDGLLQTHLSINTGISAELALQEIQLFVKQVVEQLNQNKNFVFPGIGRCYFNQTNQLEFEPETELNLLNESFGLTEVFFKPLDTTNLMSQRPVRPVVRRPGANNTTTNSENNNSENQKETTPKTNAKSGGAGKVVLILIPLFLLMGAVGTMFYLKQNGRSIASLNPFATTEVTPNAEKPTETTSNTDSIAPSEFTDTNTVNSTTEEFSNEIETVITETPSKSTLAEKQEELSKKNNTQKKEGVGSNVEQHGRYFLVIGSFIDRNNAVNLRNKMAAKGLNVTLIEKTKESRFYKVAIDDFESEEEAIKRKKELQIQFGNEVWIMSY